MKKIIFYSCLTLLLIVLLSGLASCQRKTDTYDGITVRLLTDSSGIDDKSFFAAAWQGILEFYNETLESAQKNNAYGWVASVNQDMNVPILRQVTDEGYDLIIAAGFMWTDSVETVAADNPNQNYLLIDIDWLESPNVMQAVFAEHEGSYLVGVAAALKALEDGIVNPRFGFIGGVPDAVITKFEVGYVQGILSVIPNAQIVDYYVGSWSEPGLAKTQAKLWYDSGVYAIYSAAGASGNGAIAQAKEYRTAGRNVWAIGVDSDQFEDGIYNNAGDSAVLTSMIKRVENSALYALNAVASDNFSGRVITFDLKADGVDYSSVNPALGTDIINKLEDIKTRISNEEIKVESTLASAMRLPGFPQNLRAIDD